MRQETTSGAAAGARDAREVCVLSEVTFSSGLGLLVYGLIGGSSHAWTSTRVVGPLAGAAVLLIAFIIAELRQDRPMFDMSLLRVPTFVGGLASAFAMNASMFAMLTFIVLYLQDVLHLSAIQTGVRMLVLSGAVFVSAGLAGRLSSKVPARLLIGPGFVLVGTGLLLMRGITASTSWTHFIPGFIVAGVGAGLVNTPLASVAVGVVHPRRAGMASGINSTFRQVGIAAGVAALGSIFANNIRTSVTSALAHTPAAPQAHQIASAVASGHAQQAIAHVPVRGCWKWHREHNLVPGTPGAPALQPLETDVAHDAEPPCTPLMSRRKRLLVSSGN